MKNKTIIGIGKLLKSNVLLGASALGLLTSCGAYMNGYSETDGAYYDPTRDTVPQYDTRTAGNQVGGYYSYGDDEDETYDTSIVRQSQYNQKKQQAKYQDWGKKKTDSDWGDFTGTQTYYTNNSYYGGWGYPYYGWGGWRSPFYGPYYGGGLGFGWGASYGWGYPGWGWNIGFGWGGYYPGWGVGGFYDPFWGYPYYAYRPHYWGGYYRPWAGGGYYAPRYRTRDADYIDRSRNGFRNNGSYNNGSFRGNNGNGYQDRSNNGFRNSGFRDRSQNQMPQSQQGWNNRPSDSGFRSNNGFSTGGRGGGGFGGGSAGSSGGGGGFRSGGRR
ncbi:vitellogenin ii [Elizabethkingia anophelis]|nr:vitellogenin ii [Elizabethkingia anophelis]